MRAYELSIEGKSQTEIAADLQISQPAVSKLLRRVEDRLAAEMAANRSRLRVRAAAQLEHVYAEAMQAFQRSKAPTTQRRQRKIRGTGDGEATIAELVTAERCGDPRYLEVARRAAGDLSKLAGDTVPIAEVKTTDMSQLSTPEVKDRLRRTIAALAPEYPGALEVPESTTSASALPPPRTPVQAYAEFLAERERAKAGG